MSFTESIRTCFGKFQDFSGRAQRSEYWWFTLFTLVVGMIASVIPFANIIVFLILALPNLAVTARRLHDSNHTGWWAVVPIGLAVGGAVVSIVLVSVGLDVIGAVLALLAVLGYIVGFVTLLVFLIQPGTPGPNQYGPDPLPQHGMGGSGSRGSTTIPNVREDDTGGRRFCTGCGMQLQAGARFCNACGAAV